MRIFNRRAMRTLALGVFVLSCAHALAADEANVETITRLSNEFLTELRDNKAEALAKKIGTPWYNGGEIVQKEDQLRKVMEVMAKWYDEERIKAYKVLEVGTFQKLQGQETSELGESDVKKMKSFLSDDDWLVIIGKEVDNEKRPRLYLLVKKRNDKWSVVGAHK
jgi:hypothetical protein